MSIVEKAQASLTEEREKYFIDLAKQLLIAKKSQEERLAQIDADLALVEAGKEPTFGAAYYKR